MMLRKLFTKELYLRLSDDQEFTCTTRYAGVRVWARRFQCAEVPQVPCSTEECEPGPLVRRADHRIRTDHDGEA